MNGNIHIIKPTKYIGIKNLRRRAMLRSIFSNIMNMCCLCRCCCMCVQKNKMLPNCVYKM